MYLEKVTSLIQNLRKNDVNILQFFQFLVVSCDLKKYN